MHRHRLLLHRFPPFSPLFLSFSPRNHINVRASRHRHFTAACLQLNTSPLRTPPEDTHPLPSLVTYPALSSSLPSIYLSPSRRVDVAMSWYSMHCKQSDEGNFPPVCKTYANDSADDARRRRSTLRYGFPKYHAHARVFCWRTERSNCMSRISFS